MTVTFEYLVNIAVSLLPVFLFLGALVVIDSYKLVNLGAILRTIGIGCLVAAVCFWLNNVLARLYPVDPATYSRYIAPILEESLKAGYLVYLIRRKKVGFMVDAAIYGFAIGAGFAFIENIYYLHALRDANPLLWIIRGFGTAVMHGGTTAIFGIIAKSWSDRKGTEQWSNFLPGLAVAIVVHAFFNHFILPPEMTTLMLLISLPLMILVVFDRSEKALQSWLGVGFDSDLQLLEMIVSGDISDTRVGQYLQTLKAKFPGEVVADMLCLLRLHLELSLRAKGILMMREAGFRSAPDPEIREKFAELKYLERSIGKTGLLAILPFLHTSSRDLWQIYMLGKK